MAIELWAPKRFRFTDEADVEAYGDGWYVWDEAAVTGLRSRKLIELEEATEIPVERLLAGLRTGSTLARMAAMWISLHLAGHEVAFADFDPAALTTRWEDVPVGPLGGSGEDPAPDSASSPGPDSGSATS